MAESLRSIIEGMECTCHHCCQYLEANGTVPCDCSCVKCRLLAVLTEQEKNAGAALEAEAKPKKGGK